MRQTFTCSCCLLMKKIRTRMKVWKRLSDTGSRVFFLLEVMISSGGNDFATLVPSYYMIKLMQFSTLVTVCKSVPLLVHRAGVETRGSIDILKAGGPYSCTFNLESGSSVCVQAFIMSYI